MCGGGKPRGSESAENPSLREEANRGDVPDKEAPHRVKTRRGVEAPRAVANRRPLRIFLCVWNGNLPLPIVISRSSSLSREETGGASGPRQVSWWSLPCKTVAKHDFSQLAFGGR